MRAVKRQCLMALRGLGILLPRVLFLLAPVAESRGLRCLLACVLLLEELLTSVVLPSTAGDWFEVEAAERRRVFLLHILSSDLN